MPISRNRKRSAVAGALTGVVAVDVSVAQASTSSAKLSTPPACMVVPLGHGLQIQVGYCP